jgi:hypothetical protein
MNPFALAAIVIAICAAPCFCIHLVLDFDASSADGDDLFDEGSAS